MSVAQNIKAALGQALKQLEISEPINGIELEHPANLTYGDYSSNLALKLLGPVRHGTINSPYTKGDIFTVGQATYIPNKYRIPSVLAGTIVANISGIKGVKRIEIAGVGFINFYLNSSALAEVIEDGRKDGWGRINTNKGQKVMVEYTDPNPFKEFHIGHLMSNAIGESISRFLEFSGADVKRANYQGDIGPHVAKAIWGKMQKSEASWGEAYAYGSSKYKNHQQEIDELNKKIYEGSDEVVNRLYEDGRAQSLAHFEELYRIFGTKFDYYFFESDAAPKGVELVRSHPEVFVESEGAIVYHGPHTRVFITSKGLPTYEAKELGLAQMKAAAWPFNLSISVTAHEQSGYFEVVLDAMKKVIPNLAPKLRHISHGMMRLPSGKMSSRTGEVITGESLLNDLIKEAKVRAKESRADDPEKLAQDVAVGAIKYQILRQASGRDIIFDRDRALSLDGDSGPYLQYAHARAHAIVEKAREKGISPEANKNAQPSDLSRLLHRFPEIVESATAHYEPHIVTNYLLGIASEFNRWYANEQIVDNSAQSSHKVALTDAVRSTLKNGLWLLGIPAPDRM